jgi:5'-nucleotidase
VGVIVGGHSHTLLSNGARGAEGPFPVIAEGPAGRALVVQAGAHGRWLGRLDLDLDGQGNILAWGGDARVLGQDLPGDQEVARIVAGFAAPLQEALRRVVARAPQAIDQSACRTGECAMGNLVAEAIRAHANAEVALYNGGGLRASFAAGDITWGDVLTVLPFQNTLATLGLRGRDLRAALEHGFAQPGGGRFPQIAGARVVWNPQAPAGSRIVELTVGGQPVEDERVYRVATNNFLRRGGDAYAVLRDAAIEPYDNGPNIEVVIEEALSRMGNVTVETDGRITAR